MWQAGAKIVFLKSYGQGTQDCLMNIKGSLTDRFFLAYGDEICNFDLKELANQHKNSTETVTLLYFENKTVGAFFETEIFDYMEGNNHFEREVIPRVFEDGEVRVFAKQQVIK